MAAAGGNEFQGKLGVDCQLDLHERFHCYVPRVDFVSKVNNLISDRPSRLADITDNQLLTYLETNFPQPLPW